MAKRSDASIAFLPTRISISPYDDDDDDDVVVNDDDDDNELALGAGVARDKEITYLTYFTLERSGPLRVLLSNLTP